MVDRREGRVRDLEEEGGGGGGRPKRCSKSVAAGPGRATFQDRGRRVRRDGQEGRECVRVGSGRAAVGGTARRGDDGKWLQEWHAAAHLPTQRRSSSDSARSEERRDRTLGSSTAAAPRRRFAR